MTTATTNFKFLVQNAKDVIYKELVVKGQPVLQIELAKNDSNMYQYCGWSWKSLPMYLWKLCFVSQ
jgi:hypothetical protein